MRIMTWVRMLSKIRGGAKQIGRAELAQVVITVAPDSGQETQKPAQ